MKLTEDIILQYLDGELSANEKIAFEEALAKDPDITRSFNYYKLMQESMSKQSLSSPSDDFADKVMNSIIPYKKVEPSFFNRTQIVALVLILLAVSTSIYYFTAHFYPTPGTLLTDQITLKNFTINLQPVQKILSSDLIFKMILYVNGFISLLLFDRAVLKPYFTKRRKHYSM